MTPIAGQSFNALLFFLSALKIMPFKFEHLHNRGFMLIFRIKYKESNVIATTLFLARLFQLILPIINQLHHD